MSSIFPVVNSLRVAVHLLLVQTKLNPREWCVEQFDMKVEQVTICVTNLLLVTQCPEALACNSTIQKLIATVTRFVTKKQQHQNTNHEKAQGELLLMRFHKDCQNILRTVSTKQPKPLGYNDTWPEEDGPIGNEHMLSDQSFEHFTNEDSSLQTEDTDSSTGLSHSLNEVNFPMAGSQRAIPSPKGQRLKRSLTIDPTNSSSLNRSKDTFSLPFHKPSYSEVSPTPSLAHQTYSTPPRSFSQDIPLRTSPTHVTSVEGGRTLKSESPRDYRILQFMPSVAYLRPTMSNSIPNVPGWQKLFVPSSKNKRIGSYLSRQRNKQDILSPKSTGPSVSSPSAKPFPDISFDPEGFELARKQIELGNFPAFFKILQKINVNMRDPEDQSNTLLHWAVGYNRTDIVKALLEAGALQFPNDMGMTPSELSTQAILAGDKTFQEVTDLLVGYQ